MPTAFQLVTHSGGEQFQVQVQYAGGDVTAFVVTPPIVNNINRMPLERSQLSGVNDMLSAFVLKADKLEGRCATSTRMSSPASSASISISNSPRTMRDLAAHRLPGPGGALPKSNYKPISGHYTTSELTNSLAQNDRILIWYAPLRDTGYFIPYRVLLTTSMGDLSMVLTSLN